MTISQQQWLERFKSDWTEQLPGAAHMLLRDLARRLAESRRGDPLDVEREAAQFAVGMRRGSDFNPVKAEPKSIGRWYITASAVREYQKISGLDFDESAMALSDLVPTAKLARDEGHRQIWRTPRGQHGINPDRVRLEFTVSMEHRTEGPLPQLVRVSVK